MCEDIKVIKQRQLAVTAGGSKNTTDEAGKLGRNTKGCLVVDLRDNRSRKSMVEDVEGGGRGGDKV